MDSVTTLGEAFATSQVYSPGFPIVGTGDLDLGTGTGWVNLPTYMITIDVLLAAGPDAEVTITGWTQTITGIDVLGNLTSTGGGSSGCNNLSGLIGGFVCGALPPGVAGWPPVDGGSPSSAVIDTLAQTITVVDNSNATAGTITQLYSYTFVPEASTALLLGAGLLGLGIAGRRR
jgi:hypothetical protein